ncbi:MAG: hypothetical protein MMC33_007993 [Icmadophila ericetorum]|nr:hypothetical protein [Icmadophila ericetorum]
MSASKTSKITCKNLFSDVLHRPYFCAFTPLGPYTTSIPVQNEIPRLSELTMADFSKNWAGRPFILTDEITQWPAYKEWSTEALLKAYGDVEFRAEAVDWPLKTYVEYMNSNTDESPLYLFDRAFVEKMQVMVGQVEQRQYWTPRCFGEDLFAVLGEERPDSRWLIIGPERSGSTFHKDPNATSAWNAVLRGSKYWIMFPNSMKTPPGVYVSSDESEVTSPLSIAEWLISYHAEARKTLGCIEGICNEGEILYVPSGWWHLVVNLKPSIAITENFVPEAHLVNAMKFLRDKRNQVSGFKEDVQNPYDLFIQRMEQQDTRTLSEATKLLGNIGAGKKRKWDSLVNGTCGAKAEGRNDFSFGFGEASDEDLP